MIFFRHALRGLAFAGLLLTSAAYAEQTADLGKLKSLEWTERSAAFYALAGDVLNAEAAAVTLGPAERLALIELLAFEDGWTSGRDDLGEDNAAYFADLVDVVTSLGDHRALPVLLRPGIVATGDIVIEGLARLGDPAAEAVLIMLRTASREYGRVALTLALGRMLERKTLEQKRGEVQRALIELATKDEELFVRAAAARGLGYADRAVALPVLRSLKTGAEGSSGSSVREEAKNALIRLRSNQD